MLTHSLLQLSDILVLQMRVTHIQGSGPTLGNCPTWADKKSMKLNDWAPQTYNQDSLKPTSTNQY